MINELPDKRLSAALSQRHQCSDDGVSIPCLLLTYKQAAALLQVSERTVFALVKKGQLKAVRFGPLKQRRVRRHGQVVEIEHGGTVRIDRRDLEEFILRAKTGQEPTHVE